MQSQQTAEILDVTILEPRQKHPTVFEWFRKLNEGDGFILHNDHDPKPLYYQMLGELGNIFTWEYLEAGPVNWRVLISKNDTSSNKITIGEIVAKDRRKSEVFEKYGIDFCCGGNKTVREACAEKGVDPETIEKELNDPVSVASDTEPDFSQMNADELVNYITDKHHTFVRQMLPELLRYSEKVLAAHGKNHAELFAINKLINETAQEMTTHMEKEEMILFPYIKQLLMNREQHIPHAKPGFVTVKNPVRLMEMEHELVGDNLKLIRDYTRNYSTPHDACASYQLLLKMLEEFEKDTHIHIHLENNILFPKAVQLESEFD